MKCFIILAALVAYATASHPTECGDLQRLKVKTQWAQAYDTAEDREALGLHIWQQIFHLHPEWKEAYFVNVRGDNLVSPEFRAHAQRIMSGLDMTITLLLLPVVQDAQLTHLGQQHKEMNIDAGHFDVFREALLVAVHEHVGRCFDFDAWNVCLRVITDGIQSHMA